jgi:hypothetical protein
MKPSHRIPPPLIILCALATLVISWFIPSSNAQSPVNVTAADPVATTQGTVGLNVRVTGKGFKSGARAKWLITGSADDGGVVVNSTTFVSSTELTANITVPDGATIASYDIQVLNSDGRGGKGTELFAVTAKGNQTTCGADITNLSISIYKYTDATNTTTYNLWPDLINSDGSPVPYVSGRSKGKSIDGRIQVANCSYDLTMGMSGGRYFTWKFPNGSIVGTSQNATAFNIDRVGNVPITDGGTAFLTWCNTATDNYAGCGVDDGGYFVRRSMGSAILNFNYAVRFNYSTIENIQTMAAGTAHVKIYHPNASTWIIMPEQVAPPPGVTDPNASVGEWSVLLDKSTTPDTVAGYQKMPFKIVVTKL